MRKLLLVFVIIIVLVAAGFAYETLTGLKNRVEDGTLGGETQTPDQNLNKNIMKIESDVFTDGGNIPIEYSCYGQSKEFIFNISEVPKETKSLAMIVDDPDAPDGEFVHWVVWNIDPATTSINTSNPPSGSVEGNTSLGKPGFVAPCPPSGVHHYNFKLYALNISLHLPTSANKSTLLSAVGWHILETASLVGLYGESDPTVSLEENN